MNEISKRKSEIEEVNAGLEVGYTNHLFIVQALFSV